MLDVLPVMLALQEIWEHLISLVIINCWKHIYLCNGNDALMEDITEDAYSGDSSHQEALQLCINRVVPTHARIEISQLLIPEG